MAVLDTTRHLLKERRWYSDVFVGRAEQLVAAGLVDPGQFPGDPGRAKTSTSYFLSDRKPVPHGCSDYERTYAIFRISTSKFSVTVRVSDEEARRRHSLCDNNFRDLPLDLPDTPCAASPGSPPWAPAGFTFLNCRTGSPRPHRFLEEDYVFEATTAVLLKSDVALTAALPGPRGSGPQQITVESLRFGRVKIARRTDDSFFVVLNSPSEIRNRDYEVRDLGHTVVHYGTREQLEDTLGLRCAFPGDAGTRRKVKIDNLTIEPWNWCGNIPRYIVHQDRTQEEWTAHEAKKREAVNAKLRLEDMKALPATVEAFKEFTADMFWSFARATLKYMEPQVGYRFTTETVEEFRGAVSDAYYILKDGETTGASPRNALAKELGKHAKADQPLQQFLAKVVSNPAMGAE